MSDIKSFIKEFSQYLSNDHIVLLESINRVVKIEIESIN